MSTTQDSKAFYQPILPSDQIQYREYKLLLKPELFPDQHAFHKFWKLAHHTVKPLGIKLSKMDEDVKPQQREVIFYDTPHHKLYNSGFILRKRTFYHHGTADPHHELVLKYRHPDKKVALAVDPRPLLPVLPQRGCCLPDPFVRHFESPCRVSPSRRISSPYSAQFPSRWACMAR